MTTRRATALVLGCLLLLPGFGFLLAGGGLGLTYGVGRDAAGFVTSDIAGVYSSTAAVTTEELAVVTDRSTPDWVLRRMDADLQVRVAGDGSGRGMFVGVAPAEDVAAYLAGVAHDQVTGAAGANVDYRRIGGRAKSSDPARESFWVSSTSGSGTLTLDWAVTRGAWAVVLMNADGSPGVRADVTFGAKAGFLVPLSLALLGLGAFLVAASAGLLVVGARAAPSSLDTRLGPDFPGPSVSPPTAVPPAHRSITDVRELERVEVPR